MIYPCPYCETNLNLQPEHIGRTITCPACSRSFVADDLPPVTIAEKTSPQKSGSTFGNIFKIVFYVFLAIFLLGLICTVVFGTIQYTTAPTLKDKIQGATEVLESTPTDPESANTLRELEAESEF